MGSETYFQYFIADLYASSFSITALENIGHKDTSHVTPVNVKTNVIIGILLDFNVSFLSEKEYSLKIIS